MKIQTWNDGESVANTVDTLTYQELSVHAKKYVFRKYLDYCVASGIDINNLAHDITVDFINSGSYKNTYDSGKGDLIPFFTAYLKERVKKYIFLPNAARRVYIKASNDGDEGMSISRDGLRWFVKSVDDIAGEGHSREKLTELRGVLHTVERTLGNRTHCGVELLKVLKVMVELGLESMCGDIKIRECAERLEVDQRKARVLVLKVRRIAEGCYYAR